MKLTQVLSELAFYEDAKRGLSGKGSVSISGLSDAQKAQMTVALSEGYKSRVVLTHNAIRAREITGDLQFFSDDAICLDAKDYIFFQADLSGQDIVRDRMRCMRRIIEGKPLTVVTTIDTLMAPVLTMDVMESGVFEASVGSIVETEALSKKLVRMGYEKNYKAEEPGQFSIRGGIIDIFDMTEDNPVRIELWDNEVDNIRSFDALTQRSMASLDKVVIYPASEVILTKKERMQGLQRVREDAQKQSEKLLAMGKRAESRQVLQLAEDLAQQTEQFGMMANLDSYMKYFSSSLTDFLSLFDEDDLLVVMDEPARCMQHLNAVYTEFSDSYVSRLEKGMALPGQAKLLYDDKKALSFIEDKRLLKLSTLGLSSKEGGKVRSGEVSCICDGRSIGSFNNSFEILSKELSKYHKKKYRTIVISPSVTRAKRLAADIFDEGIPAYFREQEHMPQRGEVCVMKGQLSKGFEYPSIGLCVITESDIFGRRAKKKRQRHYEGEKIRSLDQLKVGDYVVHEGCGIGVYRGIEKIERGGVTKDYMKVEYAQGGSLYVPATGFDIIQKYAAADTEKKPKINKLGTQEWTRTRARVSAAVELVAKDLVALYAARNQKKGFCFGHDTVWQKEFEELFPYEETRDQLSAIEAAKADMESDKIMDRLVCGDVGFGKTEIAIRAAFKAVQDNKQVAVLVPTTILAQQHYETFSQRMKDFPIKVCVLSRFKSTSENKKTITALQKGMADIVIGTHRLLSEDVKFKDLGLLVVDEEQRFGVGDKEKIKKLKDTVDVLTLSATPIPRTLHMSLSGVRDLSILEEPPVDRMPIQTFVMEENEEMVREAIVREISRGGQVYYVYNRVATIAEATAKIQALVPEAKVAFAHGRMKETELSYVMYDFVNGDIDVLVSTTIIETGLDIPNVNTLIVHDSDKMGLAQLYQLRGRVGRSARSSYAFLMYKRDKLLKEVAEKRLAAIREFTELGSGIRIAMRDLEIRGAGTMLGKAQHGHLEAVGYDLYLKMLGEAVKTANGEDIIPDVDTLVDMDVDAYIPDGYMSSEALKLDSYKRIAANENRDEADDMKSELADRFGKVPQEVENLLRIALLKQAVKPLYVNEISGRKDKLKFVMDPRAKIRNENIVFVLEYFRGDLKVVTGKKPGFELTLYPKGISPYDEQNLLARAEELAEQMRVRLL